MSSREMLALLRGLQGLNFVGADSARGLRRHARRIVCSPAATSCGGVAVLRSRRDHVAGCGDDCVRDDDAAAEVAARDGPQARGAGVTSG